MVLPPESHLWDTSFGMSEGLICLICFRMGLLFVFDYGYLRTTKKQTKGCTYDVLQAQCTGQQRYLSG